MEREERPERVGLLGMEMYFPKCCISQTELEKYDNVPSGKYTKGLGMTEMAVSFSWEDAQSMGANAAQRLLRNTNTPLERIGRLDVATESAVDSSKPAKSVIRSLLGLPRDVTGVDVISACHAGAQAVFNSINWVESREWDGRFGLVICTDILMYSPGPARPTGGAGAVAILIGPNAFLCVESPLKCFSNIDVYDFYNPTLRGEVVGYPVVDGKLSIETYYQLLDECYEGFKKKFKQAKGRNFSLESDVEFSAFHSPFPKMPSKALARLVFGDYIDSLSSPSCSCSFPYSVPSEVSKKVSYFLSSPSSHETTTTKPSFLDKELERAFVQISKQLFEKVNEPSLLASKRIGNLATGSLWSCLYSLLASPQFRQKLGGKQGGETNGVGGERRILMFSYGSGASASLFSFLLYKTDTEEFDQSFPSFERRLDNRKQLSPASFFRLFDGAEQAIEKLGEEKENGKGNLCGELPVHGPKKGFFEPGDWFLKRVDSQKRRAYEKFMPAGS